MVTRRVERISKAERVRATNEGADCFTDFFQERHSMNENPSEPFFDFMNKHSIDFHKGEIRRNKK